MKKKIDKLMNGKWWWTLSLTISLIVGLVICGSIGITRSVKKKQLEKYVKEYTSWYATLSEEERQKEHERALKERYDVYEVVSVQKNTSIDTDRFGRVVGNYIYYSFDYLDGTTLRHCDEFILNNSGYNDCKIAVGDSNRYIIDHAKGTKTLQLTKEMLANF